MLIFFWVMALVGWARGMMLVVAWTFQTFLVSEILDFEGCRLTLSLRLRRHSTFFEVELRMLFIRRLEIEPCVHQFLYEGIVS